VRIAIPANIPPKNRGLFRFNRRKVLAAIVFIVLSALGAWLAASAAVAWSFTRRHRERAIEPPPKVASTDVEVHRLKTCDGEEIGAWFVRGKRQKGCVLLLHGIGASRREMLPVMQWLVESGYSVLAVSFRAHGDSTGEIIDIGWSARHDVTAAVGFLRQACPGQPVYVVGRSMGAAAAIFAAKELQGDVAGYFLEQPYKDLESAVWCRLHHHIPPGLDWVAYLGLRLWAPLFLPVSPNQISPYEHVRDIPENVPIVFVTGSADRHALLADVTGLYERVRSHATLVVFQGAIHEALDRNNPQLYRTSLFGLLDSRNAQ
jgi:alpha-beta hydrolase superfamily lysophospholipase